MSTLAFYGYGGTGITIPTPVSVRHTDVDDECMYGVFVGDLPPDANEQDLVKLFTNANLPVVKCKIIRDAENNSKRYGFVHFQTEELRQRAINEMHGVSVNGQTINVRTQHYRETDRCLVKPGQKKTDIYIGNIPKTLTKYQVREAIADWGLPKVQDVKVFKNDTGMFCFISFATEGEVSQVMAHLKDNPKLLAGRHLLVQSSGTSITSTLNAELLRNPNYASSPEEQQIVQSIQLLKEALGGSNCPLNDRQLALLEKSQRTLYVRNLHPSTTESALNQKFNKYGKLRKVIIVTDKDTKVPMGYGFVEFYTSQACTQASMDEDCELDGQLLTLQVSRPPKEIHAIITAAGLTDASGNLLSPFTAQVLPQPTYFQDAQGQLFVGDGLHAQQYLTQGYVTVPNLGGGLIMQQPMLQSALQPQMTLMPQQFVQQQMLPQQVLQTPQLQLQLLQQQQMLQARQLQLHQQLQFQHQQAAVSPRQMQAFTQTQPQVKTETTSTTTEAGTTTTQQIPAPNTQATLLPQIQSPISPQQLGGNQLTLPPNQSMQQSQLQLQPTQQPQAQPSLSMQQPKPQQMQKEGGLTWGEATQITQTVSPMSTPEEKDFDQQCIQQQQQVMTTTSSPLTGLTTPLTLEQQWAAQLSRTQQVGPQTSDWTRTQTYLPPGFASLNPNLAFEIQNQIQFNQLQANPTGLNHMQLPQTLLSSPQTGLLQPQLLAQTSKAIMQPTQRFAPY